jgi:hypothetical protein
MKAEGASSILESLDAEVLALAAAMDLEMARKMTWEAIKEEG